MESPRGPFSVNDSKPLLAFALEYPIAYGGGVSVIVRTLLRGLAGEYRLALVSPDSAADLETAGVAALLEHHLPWQKERASAARARELVAHLLAWGARIVHFHAGGNYGWGNRRPGTSPAPLLRRAGVKCVSTVHLVVSVLADVLPPASPLWLRAAALPVAWLGKMQSLRGVHAEIAVSEHDLRRLRRWYLPLRHRFRRIYHSQLPEEPPAPLPMAARDSVILHVGHRATRKGQHVLVRAFAEIAPRHPEWRLHLVGPPGDDAFERELKSVFADRNIEERVKIEGSCGDAAALMQRAAIYVQPSLHEALGLALQEALYHGCAGIGTTAGGIPELIAHEQNGLLVPPADVSAMAGALTRSISEAGLRHRLGSAAPASIVQRGMTAGAMLRAHRALYMELLDAR